MKKLITAVEVAARLSDGMTLGIGGWGGRRKPMALIREILRSPLKDLTVVSYGGCDVGMLCAAGKVKKLIFGFVSLDVLPLEAWFRRARQAGQLEVMELDEGMLQWGLRAAAMRLPFLPTRAGLGTDIMTTNPQLRTVRSPYDDREVLLAMPALPLDAALIHVNCADANGNSLLAGPDPFFDELFARAADKCYLSCDRLVDVGALDNAQQARADMPIERSLISGVTAAQWGAHPTSCGPRYGIDVGHLKEYSALARKEDGWQIYCDKYLNCSESEYQQRVGGIEAIAALPLPVF